MRQTARRLFIGLLAAAAVGLTVFGWLAIRAVNVAQAPAPEALRRFTEVRARLGAAVPLLTLDDAGNVVRRSEAPEIARRPIRRFRALVYESAQERLIAVDVPFWFYKLKGKAAEFAVRDTGLDLARLQITGADLERYEPSVVIDHVRPNGDRVLVWTE